MINQKNGITLDDQNISIRREVNNVLNRISLIPKNVALSLKKEKVWRRNTPNTIKPNTPFSIKIRSNEESNAETI